MGEVERACSGSVSRGAGWGALAAPDFEPSAVAPAVAGFHVRTAAFELDSWAEWCGPFRPFGWLLARLFSRRLQQLNVPLSGLDTSRGVTSDVLQLVEPATGALRYTAWVRELLGSGNVLYAGTYSLAEVPGRQGPCVSRARPAGPGMDAVRASAQGEHPRVSGRERPRRDRRGRCASGSRAHALGRYVPASPRSPQAQGRRAGPQRGEEAVTNRRLRA